MSKVLGEEGWSRKDKKKELRETGKDRYWLGVIERNICLGQGCKYCINALEFTLKGNKRRPWIRQSIFTDFVNEENFLWNDRYCKIQPAGYVHNLWYLSGSQNLWRFRWLATMRWLFRRASSQRQTQAPCLHGDSLWSCSQRACQNQRARHGTISPILSAGKLGNRFDTPDDLMRDSLDISRENSKKSFRFVWFQSLY